MKVKKTTGSQEPFDKHKLCGSLLRAGASEKTAEKICSLVKTELKPGMTTNSIFRKALQQLVQEDLDVAAVYSLKRGVDALGPSGFLFEQYVEAILRLNGYTTRRNQFMRGRCVEHEVDIHAVKDSHHFIIEAKFRNDSNIKTHINDVMYAHARTLDIREGKKFKSVPADNMHVWLITNTQFTKQSERYARCHDIRLTGWNHPHEFSLQNMIVQARAYPITVIPALTKEAREVLTKHNMILAQDLVPYTPEQLHVQFAIPEQTARKIHTQALKIISPQ